MGRAIGHRTSLLTAILVGVALAGLVTVVVGWLAALAIPATLLHSFGAHRTLLFVLHSVVLIGAPVMLLSCVVGLMLFAGLRDSSAKLALICAAPWVLYVGYDMLHALTQIPAATNASLTFSLVSWSTVLTVPAGLLLASLSRYDGPPTTAGTLETSA